MYWTEIWNTTEFFRFHTERHKTNLGLTNLNKSHDLSVINKGNKLNQNLFKQ